MELVLEQSRSKFMSKVMFHMSGGLFVTFILGYLMANVQAFLVIPALIFSSKLTMLIYFFILLFLVGRLSAKIWSMSLPAAYFWYYLYAALNATTFAIVFFVFDLKSIIYVFLVATIMFFSMGIIGIATNKDLTTFGSILLMALIGLIVASLLNIFFMKSSQTDYIISIIGVIVFCGLTVYDMNKLKNIHLSLFNNIYKPENLITEDGSVAAIDIENGIIEKFAILGALTLYLDFINLFTFLLRILGKKK